MTCIGLRVESLERRIRDLEFNNGQLIIEKSKMGARIQCLELALARGTHGRGSLDIAGISRDPELGPELPNGEGIAGEISAGIRGIGDPDPDPPTLGGLHHGGL
jgi:hypothetical protein